MYSISPLRTSEQLNGLRDTTLSIQPPIKIIHLSNSTLNQYPSSEICHLASSSITSSGVNIMVVGASSFIGASIAKVFHKSNMPVIASEDNVNIGFDPMAWYRWESLISMGVSPQYVNFSNHDMTVSFLKKSSPKTIVYVPTPFFDRQGSERNTRQITELHEDFLLLLQVIKKDSPSTSVILVSILEPKDSYSSLIKLFELSLSVYNRLYGMHIAIIRTSGVYGPWMCDKEPSESVSQLYIDDFVAVLQNVIDDGSKLLCKVTNDRKNESKTSFQKGLELTRDWLKEYRSYLGRQTKDIIASPYFTTKRNAQYPIEFMTNNYYFLENWFKNIYKMNLHMVVFHDDLSDKFVSTFKQNYPKADFDKIKDFKDFRPNDRRYLAYYDYILAHPEINRIVMTDMRDVIIQNNPFEVLDVLGDIPYVGLDRPFFDTARSSSVAGVFKRCFEKGVIPLDYHKEIDMLGFLNSGVTAGTRHVTLAILTRFLSYFKISTKDNCNMALVGYIYHKYYFDVLATGWPFNTAFVTDMPNIPGLAVLHKWDLNSYN